MAGPDPALPSPQRARVIRTCATSRAPTAIVAASG